MRHYPPVHLMFKWILILIALELVTGYLFRGVFVGMLYDNVLMFLKIFMLTYFVLKKLRHEFKPYLIAIHIFYLFWIGTAIYQYFFSIEIRTIGWTNDLWAIIGLWAAYLFNRYQSKLARILTLTISVLTLTAFLFSFKHFDHFKTFKTFKTFKHHIYSYVNPASYTITNEAQDTIKLQKDIIYIFDMWYTRCGYCY